MAVVASRVSGEQMAQAWELLERFVRIPSVSDTESSDYSMDSLREAATFARTEFSKLGFDTREISIDGSAPYVLAQKIVKSDLPTILLYGHYDVQPVDRKEWTTDPFVIVERDGRLYGRGSSDDKAGIVTILTALGALMEEEGDLPVNVKILLEGEEEVASSHMGALLAQEADELRADALVIMDGGNRNVETGTLTSSTRGLVNIGIEVKALEKPFHSGVACLAPDPSKDLIDLLHSLRDPRDIPGFFDDSQVMGAYERRILRESSQSSEVYAQAMGVVAGGTLRGDPRLSISERVLEEPSISIVNMVAGQRNGGNSIQDKATATVGIRLTPGQDPERISRIVVDHLLAQTAELKSASVTITPHDGCWAWKANLDGPLSRIYMEALRENFPRSCAEPCGGALPLLHEFQRVYPAMEMIVPGVEDPKCAAHSHNESQDLNLWERATNALMTFLRNVGRARE